MKTPSILALLSTLALFVPLHAHEVVSLFVSGVAGFPAAQPAIRAFALGFLIWFGLQSASCPIRVEGKKKRSHLWNPHHPTPIGDS
jgi:hypothetical protein